MVLNNSSTKKGHIKRTFYILNVAYILKTILSKLFFNRLDEAHCVMKNEDDPNYLPSIS